VSAAARTIGKAAAQKLSGEGPGRIRALAAATVAGAAAAVLTYRVLRTGT
jgi:hypothetical protein